jgi:hypothetical protein
MDANDYRDALQGTSNKDNLNIDWQDKPHRLVYDLCNEVEYLQGALKDLIKIAEQCDGWESFPSESLDEAGEVLSSNK